MSALAAAALSARLDQYRALVQEISADPLARARLADRLIQECLQREAAEIKAEIDALEG